MICRNENRLDNKGFEHLLALLGPNQNQRIGTLKKRADFITVSGGNFVRAQGFFLQGRHRNEPGYPTIRVGFTCSKKVGNAVKRNRAKRRLRAIANQILPKMGNEGWDYVLIGQAKITEQTLFSDLLKYFKEALRKIHKAQENT